MNVATLLNDDGTVKTTKYTAGGGGTTIVANFDGLIALTGMTAGSQAYVTETNKLFFYTGVGWYLIATVQNDAPSAITGVEGSYSLAIDGTATTITAVSTDPEGFPLTWTYVASGLGSIATVSQADNVFTVTPSTDEANTGSFTLTISATDGINGAVSTIPSFALEFIVPNSKYTTLLATAVSTGDNNNITDASSNNHTITVAGDTYAGSFSPYRHGGYSTQFDGASDYLEIYNDSSLVLAGSPWTIECWVKPSGNYSTYRTIFAKRAGTTSYEGYLRLSTGVVSFYNGTNYESTTVLDANSWSHVAYVYDGSNINIYVNGVRVLTTAVTITEYNHPIWIGGVSGHTEWFQGNIRDFRILKGTALYTGTTLTPPTEPLTAITNTSLLICQLPYIVDVSTNAHAITVSGNVSTTPFNTYDYAPYSAGTNGGSVYFDGVGDYLTGTSPATMGIGTGDFTIECWFNATDESIDVGVWDTHTQSSSSDGLTLTRITPTTFRVWDSSQILVSSATAITDNWNHLAVVRNSGTLELFVNGVSQGTVSNSTNMNSAQEIMIGGGRYEANSTPTAFVKGYIGDFRVITSAVYTAAFTPPTAPLSSSGSSLHIKGTDASIVDKSQVSNLKMVGNTTASTTQIKYGNSSIYFDGVGDYAFIENGFPDAAADFTVEFWVNPSNVSNNKTSFYDARDGQPNSPIVWQDNAGIYLYAGADRIVISSGLSAGTWAHVSLVRSSGVYKLYLNGTASGTTYANTDALVVKDLYIGARFTADSSYYDGYIDDFRISKTARYTANFTPPTESLKG